MLLVYSNDVTLVGNDCCQCAMVLFSLFAIMASNFGGVELGQLHSKNQRFLFQNIGFLGHIQNLRISDPRISDPGMWNPWIQDLRILNPRI